MARLAIQRCEILENRSGLRAVYRRDLSFGDRPIKEWKRYVKSGDLESPAKAKTIKKYLGSGYEVVASMGHIRDLPKSKIGVDIENGFKPDYIEMKDKKELISSLKKQAKKSEKVYLATDPDREGEAISWHLAYILGLDLQDQNRVTFNEITKSGVKNGMDAPPYHQHRPGECPAGPPHPGPDRVAISCSPFLWKKVRRGLSAGRVQSVTVRLICDREEEIRKFLNWRSTGPSMPSCWHRQPAPPLPPSSTAQLRARWSFPTRRKPTASWPSWRVRPLRWGL